MINLAGSELPLYSVDELSERLSKKEDLKMSTVSYHDNKFNSRYKFIYGKRKNGKKGPIPYNLVVYKGYKNVFIRRDFADFILNHPVSQSVMNFLKDAAVPDEHLYATLGRIEQIDENFNER